MELYFGVIAVMFATPEAVKFVTIALSAFCVARVPMDVGGVGGKALEIKTHNTMMMNVQPDIIPIRSLISTPYSIQQSKYRVT